MRDDDMKLQALYERELYKLHKKFKPTFVGMKLSPESNAVIAGLTRGIPNKVSDSSIHTTLIYSREPIYFNSTNPEKPIKAKAKHYSIFVTPTGINCLVIELDSDDLVARHNHIMNSTNASYDFPEYKPHITLSYNIGDDFDLDTMPDINDIPELTFDTEYSQELDFSWGKNNTLDS